MKARLAGLFLLFVPSLSIAQNPTPTPPTPPTRDQVLSAARTVIQNARFATLVTLDESGAPQARIVDPFAPDSAFTTWVGTNPLTRKVEQIARNPRVVLLWFEAPTAYVSLSGRAELVRDSAQKEKHWKPEWAWLYRNANHGDDYLLIRVIPTHMEVVGRGMAGDPKTWRPVMIDFDHPSPARITDQKQEIINLSKEKWRWMSERKVDSLAALFDTGAVFVHMGGTMSRSQELDVIRSGAIQYKHAEIQETSVRFIDKTAILLNKIRLLAVVGGNEVTNPFVVTEVYVQQNGAWKLGSLSFTRLLTP